MKPSLNTPFRDYQRTLFEGGIRVPLIASWQGEIKPKTESTQVGCLMDLTASFLRAAGATVPKSLDCIDLLAHVETSKPNFSRELFWRAKRGTSTWSAARIGNMKLVRKVEDGETEEWTFDLAKDPGEQSPLTHPEKTTRLQNVLTKCESTATVVFTEIDRSFASQYSSYAASSEKSSKQSFQKSFFNGRVFKTLFQKVDSSSQRKGRSAQYAPAWGKSMHASF